MRAQNSFFVAPVRVDGSIFYFLFFVFVFFIFWLRRTCLFRVDELSGKPRTATDYLLPSVSIGSLLSSRLFNFYMFFSLGIKSFCFK